MINLGRTVLFFICLWFSLVPIAHAFEYLTRFGPASHEKLVVLPWLLLTCLGPPAVVAGVVCFPIAWAYGRAAPWIALFLSAPFAVLCLYLVRPNAKALELALAWSSAVSYVVLVTGATMLARRYLIKRRTGRNAGIQAVA
jgi:hypothetical protein